MSLKVKEARKELEDKTYREIEVETAWKWASRAAAAYEKVKESGNKLGAWSVAEEFYHEAVEHAALSEDEGELLKKIKKAVEPYQEQAAEVMADALEKK